jgi:hypothetical protein
MYQEENWCCIFLVGGVTNTQQQSETTPRTMVHIDTQSHQPPLPLPSLVQVSMHDKPAAPNKFKMLVSFNPVNSKHSRQPESRLQPHPKAAAKTQVIV